MAQDDWRAETQTRLATSALYNSLKEKCKNDAAGAQVLQLVDDATYYAFQRTKTILVNMGEFTLHDGDHLFRVLLLMEQIISIEEVQKLTIPEYMLLILSAFFHDIGMAPTTKEVESWKKVWDEEPEFIDASDKISCGKFRRYYMAKHELKKELEKQMEIGNNSTADLQKSYLISDYIRTTHAHRAREIIKADWDGKIKYRDCDLTVELASICFSHNEDPLSILNLDTSYLCGPNVYANIQLIALVLRLADILDFDGKRTPRILYSHLFVRHPVSLFEWQKHRSIDAWNINKTEIQFHAKCDHPAIEASIHQFCDLIDRELFACRNQFSTINGLDRRDGEKLSIGIPVKVDRSKIETKKNIDGDPVYLYRDTKFNLNKNQVIDLLMGTKLYGDPEVALRELLQNSIDACLLRAAQEAAWKTAYTPLITIKYYKEEHGEYVLEIDDNGTGMDQAIIDSYYSKIGSSFYKSTDFYEIQSQTNAQFKPTSRFGIGILSCFMVADTLLVDTRRVYGPHKSSEPINLRVEGQDSIFWITPGEREIPGTLTKLILRVVDNPWLEMDSERFIKSIDSVIPNPPFRIEIETDDRKITKNEFSFAEITPQSLKDSWWSENENIKELTIEFSDGNLGFVGSAIVAILQSDETPLSMVEMTSNSIKIEEETYHLERSIFMNGGEIRENASSITIDEEGNIDESNSFSTLFKSRSKLSLNGIEVPHDLFPDSWKAKKNQVKIDWPFPILIVVDIFGDRDIDLNSSRTQVILSDKWLAFEEALFNSICNKIKENVESEYWESFKDHILGRSKNDVIIKYLEEVGE